MDFISILKTAISSDDTPWVFEYEESHFSVFPTSTDFGNSKPQLYITYDWYSTPVCFADGEEQAYDFNLSLHIVTDKYNDELYKTIIKRLKSHDFVYQGETNNFTENYPQNIEKILEFRITISTEMEE